MIYKINAKIALHIDITCLRLFRIFGRRCFYSSMEIISTYSL